MILNALWARSTVVVTVGNFLIKGLALLAMVIIMRTFAPADYGIVVTMISLMTIVPVLMDFGTAPSMIRFGPMLHTMGLIERRNQLYQFAFHLRMVFGLIFIFLGVIFARDLARLLLHNENQSHIIIIAIFGSLGASFLQYITSVLQSEERFETMTLANILEAGLKVVMILAMIWLIPARIPEYAITIYAIAPLATVLVLIPFKPVPFFFRPKPEISLYQTLFRFSFYYMLSSVCLMIFMNFDFLIVAALKPAEEVGYFGSGNKLASILFLFVQAANTILMPKISRKLTYNAFVMFVRRSIGMCLLGAVLMVPFAFLGPVIIPLVAGPAYIPSLSVFRILAWDQIMMMAFTPFMIVLFAVNRPALLTGIVFVEMLLNIVGDILLVPRWGGAGAAAVTLSIRVVVGTLGSLYLYYRLKTAPDYIRQVI